ncbi:MAG: peroxide stress protein YaaA [Mariprofundaceae bacterium]|nr:peroxide stress protein YaaA [Mariprofundaceae bacterium]
MLLLISPAKKLDMQTPATVGEFTQPCFADQAAVLVDILRMKSAEELAALMKISPNLAQLNQRRYHDWRLPFTLENAKQSLFAFRGDVYAALDADSLDVSDIDYAQQHLRLLSGLYGMLRPLDLMQAYRLEMGTRLANAHGRDLYAFWGDALTHAINAQLAGHRHKVAVNLASGEYARAVHWQGIEGDVLHIHFKEQKDDGYRVIGIHAKRARGLMCRYAIEHKAENPHALQGFDAAGYRFRADMSSASDWVFAR